MARTIEDPPPNVGGVSEILRHDSLESMKRDKLMEAIGSTTTSLARPKIDPRQKKSFPANIDDWRPAVPELTKSSRGASLEILHFQPTQTSQPPLIKPMQPAP